MPTAATRCSLTASSLSAQCGARSLEPPSEGVRRTPNRLAQAVDLDMAASWTPTAANFLGRVTKARIQQAVAEARGQRAADRIEHLKKVEMATEAETLLAGSRLAARAPAHPRVG